MSDPDRPTIIYLDVDDEITSAAARIRATGTERVALVLPSGSRLATSRINFRLLAREATARTRELSIVAPEAGARSLASSAGLPVFATVTEYESAVAAADSGPPPPDGGAPASNVRAPGGPRAGDVGRGGSGLRGGGTPRGIADGRATGARREPGPWDRPDETRTFDGGTIVTRPWPHEDPGSRVESEQRPGPGRRWLAILAALLLVLVVVSGVGAYMLLPTAIVTLRAVPEIVGPLTLEITADPLAAAPDAIRRVVPAELVTFELEVSGDFAATGLEVTETTSSGVLRWTNCDPTSAYTIRAGTRARTASGVAFATTEAVFLPIAGLSGSNPPALTCQSRDVPAEAIEVGTSGNVAAGTVTTVPSNLNAVVIRVTNPRAMTGGDRIETPLITVEDVRAAQRRLIADLRTRFEAQASDPDRAPAGTVIVPQTRSSSEPEPDGDPASLVGKEAATFSLTYRATGTVTAVPEAAVRALADALIRAEVAADRSLVRGSITIEVGSGKPRGAAVVMPVVVQAFQVGSIDADAVRSAITGRSIDAARARLRDFGDADLVVWPDWVTAIPTLDFRLEVRVVADVPTEPTTTSPPSAGPSATPRRSGSPAPSRPASPAGGTPSAPAGSPRATPSPSGS